ncbi:MAG: serine/threonine-protein kinase [Candidatus Electryoneaceae bacterium]|nr:serine/threonine-protein kinase [Candidatus Electryoneaceae bacterium]
MEKNRRMTTVSPHGRTGRLGRYRIDAELSRSTVTTVYRAYDEDRKRSVLIKKLHPQMVREEDIFLRFEREAQACALVKHKNIVDIYEFHSPDESSPELAMLVLEFIEGLTLGTLIARAHRIDWRVAMVLLAGVLEGLIYAHSKGVIHRDIKPENILISLEGEVKITDFGLAILEDTPKLTRQGMMIGTPSYLSPEVINGHEPNERSDLFSLGVTFYEVLTKKSPFQGQTVSETLQNILNHEPEPPSSIAINIPPELDRIILRLLDKQPQQRYPSAEQVSADIRHFADGLNIPTVCPEIVRSQMAIYLTDSDEQVRPNDTTHKDDPAKAAILGNRLSRFVQRHSILVWTTTIAALIAVVFLLINQNWPGDTPTPIVLPEISADSIISDLSDDSVQSEDLSGNGAVTPDVVNQETIIEEQPPPIESDDQNRRVGPVRPEPTWIISSQPIRSGASDTTSEFQQGGNTPDDAVQPAQPRTGTLRIACRQWATVSIDNVVVFRGQTPFSRSFELGSGEHQIVLSNSDFPSPVAETVVIRPDEERILDFDLLNYFARIQILSVVPWAEIFIGGVSYGDTPRASPIHLPFGQYTIELRNPYYKVWREEVTIRRGDSPVEISVRLERLE